MPSCVPGSWSPGKLITAQEAERRVLVLENPGLRGQSRAHAFLYAGLQLVLPGEIARAHRHSQSALRFIVSGDGAYTAVDGERVTMHVGDFIITPSWTWHDHGNPSERADRLDGRARYADGELLDCAVHGETTLRKASQMTRTEGESFARYGKTMMPLDYKPRSRTSPLFWYPVRPHARSAGDACQERGRAPEPRPQAAVREPGHGRRRRCPPSAPSCRCCPKVLPGAATGAPTVRCFMSSREKVRWW